MLIRKVSIFIITLILILSGLPFVFELTSEFSSVKAAKIIVDLGGDGDYDTIQGALTIANPGDTIYVWAGTYYENLNIHNKVTLIGNGTGETIIDGGGSGDVLKITVDWVSIIGLTVNNSGSNSGNAGVELNYAKSCTIKKCNITNNYYGIYVLNSNRHMINNNTISDNNVGIYSVTSENGIVSNNNITYNTQSAYDSGTNKWDGGYYYRGNYWSDYPGDDTYQGEDKDILGSDGIGDQNYTIPGGDNVDRYPLIKRPFTNNTPPKTPITPIGETSGLTGFAYLYNVSTSDLDADKVKYGWDWEGDKIVDHWSELYYSGSLCYNRVSHIWTKPGTYYISVIAIDEQNTSSGWANPLEVNIILQRPPNKPSKPEGETNCVVGQQYTYTSKAIDPDGDRIQYQWQSRYEITQWSKLVKSGTKTSCSFTWSKEDSQWIKVIAMDEHGNKSYSSDTLEIIVTSGQPDIPSIPKGITVGVNGTAYSFSSSTIDPFGDKISYGWDWDGDHVVDEWSGLVESGTIDNREHTWAQPGIYNVSVMVEDEYGKGTNFSIPLQVTIYLNIDTDKDGKYNFEDDDDDNDGFSDTEELAAGKDPLNKNSYPRPPLKAGDFKDLVYTDPEGDDYYIYIEGDSPITRYKSISIPKNPVVYGLRNKDPDVDIVKLEANLDSETQIVSVTLGITGYVSWGLTYNVYFVNNSHEQPGKILSLWTIKEGLFDWKYSDNEETYVCLSLERTYSGPKVISDPFMPTAKVEIIDENITFNVSVSDLEDTGLAPDSGFGLYAYCSSFSTFSSATAGESKEGYKITWDAAGVGAAEAPEEYNKDLYRKRLYGDSVGDVEVSFSSLDELKIKVTAEIPASEAAIFRPMMDINQDGTITKAEIEAFEQGMVELSGTAATSNSGVYLDEIMGSMRITKYEIYGAEGDVTSNDPITGETTMELTFSGVDKNINQHTLKLTLFVSIFNFEFTPPKGFKIINYSGLFNDKLEKYMLKGVVDLPDDTIITFEIDPEYVEKKEAGEVSDNTMMISIVIIILIIVIIILALFLSIRKKRGSGQKPIEKEPKESTIAKIESEQITAVQPQQLHQPQQTQQQYQSQQTQQTQQLQQPPLVDQRFCSTCGLSLKYYQKNNSYYCHTCQKYE